MSKNNMFSSINKKMSIFGQVYRDGTPRLCSLFPHIAFVPIFPSFEDFDFTSLQLMLVGRVFPYFTSADYIFISL